MLFHVHFDHLSSSAPMGIVVSGVRSSVQNDVTTLNSLRISNWSIPNQNSAIFHSIPIHYVMFNRDKINSTRPEQNVHFAEVISKCFYWNRFLYCFTEFCTILFPRPNWLVISGSDNELVPKRRQSIMLCQCNDTYMRHLASMTQWRFLFLHDQGSHIFSKMKFQDFSRTYQGQNHIFQAISSRYLVYCKHVFVWWNNLPYT